MRPPVIVSNPVSTKVTRQSTLSTWYGLTPPSFKSTVKSAFNGLAIYKVKSVLNSSYKIATCEHIGLHVDMIKNGKDKLYINPFFTGYSGYQGQIGSGLRSITSIFS